jgi:nucleotide-binding universal stress UspA family protein
MNTEAYGPIVAGYDGDAVAELALRRAAQYAKALDTPLVVVAVEPVLLNAGLELAPAAIAGGPPIVAPWPPEGAEEEVHKEWDDRLEEARRCLEGKGVEVELVHRAGDATDELVKVARERSAQLLVVGAHQKGFLDRLLVGSVSESVVRRADCDVLVVHGSANAGSNTDQEAHK